jgi:hypothetical protein
MDDESASAATFFLRQAQAAIEAADTARTEDAIGALYKEAETWLYMASKCLGRDNTPLPNRLGAPHQRVTGEPRSFRDR